MTAQVQALYDFTGDPGTTEMSIASGEILTLINTDIGEGWWEGRNAKGETGLFPAAYVRKLTPEELEHTSTAPTHAAPAVPRYDQAADDWGDQQYSAGDNNYHRTTSQEDGWEDDWDDETYSEIGPAQHKSHHNQHQPMPLPGMPINDVNHLDDGSSNYGSSAGTVRRNKFAPSSKVTGESYLLGTLNVEVPDHDKIYIVQNEEGYVWSPLTHPYSVTVASPKKESKFKGIKSYIAYQLTPSFNNIQVSRRYKHFDWLHERLQEKFTLIPIPPLPDKQISGRYDEQLIERRRVQLQEFVDWMCRHPVLSKCEVWQHFLTCTDEKRWKAGKRQAERDPLLSLNYCISLVVPEKALLQTQVDGITEQCHTFVASMDTSVKSVVNMCITQTKRFQGPYKMDCQKVGEALYSLGNALSLDEGTVVSTSKLTSAIKMTGGAYIEIGRMYDEQPKYDWEPLGDKFHLYKGIVGSFPDVLANHKGAVQKKRECERLTAEHKMEVAQLNEVLRRTDVISYALLAEVNHFKAERTTDLKATMQKFLRQQITFYKKIVEKLESTLQQYDE
ncbi:sorting nexin lst-4 isoform X1 [Galleria mellonella]|uniref:Sorting nexin n=1 Tax=Galleria mellonella TaxID=7137 RepID=A0A6J1W7A0_GALME|nr:sorting nexin lst-4 isoform X1 [Galleria mellonella]XP_052758764.1 sorting nexin lst-4 isoform X1 [Galleria mellonella]